MEDAALHNLGCLGPTHLLLKQLSAAFSSVHLIILYAKQRCATRSHHITRWSSARRPE